MTAEVGVLNRLGVALAADSAVSIGREANKIWTSADKLFHLSPSAPVGVMIYGNASFVGVPWESAVKEFRRNLGKTRYNTLEGYAERFFRFLAGNRALFPRVAQDRATDILTESLFLHVRQEAQAKLTLEAERRNGLDEADIGPIIEAVVKNRLGQIRSRPLLKGFDRAVRQAVRDRYEPALRRAREKVFGKLPLTNATRRALGAMAREMLNRHYMGPARAGVVVAGFGEREATPSLLSYDVEEMAAGKPRRTQPDRTLIGLDNDAVIVPFAQQEMVHSFLRGVDLDLAAHMRQSTTVLFDGTVIQILEGVEKADKALRQSIEAEIRPEIPRLLKGLFDDWEAQTARHWKPVVEIVASLPKDELAAMAEALVNLTKFRRRITPERETVGGPIDVAVITKGDGFVWVKRKHYFDQALNPRVIARYMREG